RGASRKESSCHLRLHPDCVERFVDDLPALPLRRELTPAVTRDPVVLPPPAGFGFPPLRRDQSLAFEPMQHWVQHAVGPLQVAAGELGHALDDGVAVAIALGEDGEHQRRGRRGDEVLAEVHANKLYTLRFYVCQRGFADSEREHERGLRTERGERPRDREATA